MDWFLYDKDLRQERVKETYSRRSGVINNFKI